jgi:cytochrome P450
VSRTDDFSSNLVSLLHNDGTGRPVAFPIAPYRDPIHVLSTADPPLHTRHRKLLQNHLSPAALAELAPSINRIVDEYLDGVLAGARVDIVSTFSDPVPAQTICEVIGLPAEDVHSVLDFAGGTGALLDGITDLAGMHRAATSAFELTIFVHRRLEAALESPARDRRGLLAVFADFIESGEVTVDEVRDMLVVLVTAGSETTASLLATAVETLSRDPALQTRLREQPELIPGAIEEMLRVAGPFQFHYRYTPRDTGIGDTPIPAHSRVLLMWAAANRPAPGAAPAPEDMGASGRAAPHFAFGRGLHFCIGAPLARLEARIALEHLLARSTSLEIDTALPTTRRPSIFMRRHASLPVVVDAS